jgi:hypothetical protein
MKAVAFPAFLLAASVLALAPAISAVYGEAYPAEAAKRAALAVCARSDPGFDRFYAGQRAQCYARQLSPPPIAPAVPRRQQLVEAGWRHFC